MDILRCRRQGDETQKLRGEDRLSHKEEKETGKGPKPETEREDKTIKQSTKARAW